MYSKVDIIKLYINYIIKLKYYIRKEDKEIGRKGIYYSLSYLVNICIE